MITDLDKLKLKQIICSNVRTLAISKGMSNAQLMKKAQLSESYANMVMHPEKFNATIEVLMALADALDVSVKNLLDQDLRNEALEGVPPNMKKYELTLTEYQYSRIKPWLKINKERAKEYREHRALRLNRFSKYD